MVMVAGVGPSSSARFWWLPAIGDGEPGVLHLVRTWFDEGSGQCSHRHALEVDP